MSPQSVLDFWFVECTPKQWFGEDRALDEKIRDRFASVHEKAMRGELQSWRATPEGRLAEIILLDQFSRNMFRHTSQAFASDSLALILAEEAIAVGADRELPSRMRHFLYMPFMHSESKQAHRKALWLFLKSWNWSALKFEIAHKRVIDRFGRYPHRNAILGRSSTPEELEFLKTNPGW